MKYYKYGCHLHIETLRKNMDFIVKLHFLLGLHTHTRARARTHTHVDNDQPFLR